MRQQVSTQPTRRFQRTATVVHKPMGNGAHRFHMLSTFGGNRVFDNRLTAGRTAYSVPSTKPPDGRHARRGRLAIPMSLEVSSFSSRVRQRPPPARVELRASKRYGVCRGDGRPGSRGLITVNDTSRGPACCEQCADEHRARRSHGGDVQRRVLLREM